MFGNMCHMSTNNPPMGGRSNMDKPKLTPNQDINELLLSECKCEVGIYGICTDGKDEEIKRGEGGKGGGGSQGDFLK